MGEKLGAAAGLFFAICIFMGNGLLVGDSSTSDPAEKLLTALSDTDQINLGVAISVLAVGFLVYFASTLRTVLARFEPAPGRLSSAAMGACVAAAATLTAGPGLMRTVAWRIEEDSISADIAALAHGFTATMYFTSAVFLGLAALAVAAVTIRYGALPRWFGWFSVLMGLLMIVGAVGAPLNEGLGFIAGVPLMLYFLVASIVLIGRAGAAAPAPALAE